MTLSLELALAPLVAGLALLLLGAIWRALARERRQRRARDLLRAALADPDPLVRLAAVQVAVQQGISPVAGELLKATRTEGHSVVLEGITEAVARHQWEPTLEPELLELRLWAQRRLVEIRREERAAWYLPPNETSPPIFVAPTNGVSHEPVAPPAPAPAGVIRRLLGDRASRASRARKRS